MDNQQDTNEAADARSDLTVGLGWKDEYLKEYERTTGKKCVIEQYGAWYRLTDLAGFKGSAYRKADLMRMIETLRERRDYA